MPEAENPATDVRIDGNPEEHRRLAGLALESFGIDRYDLAFIRHNENLVHQVTDTESGERFLLRIHLPRFKGFQGIQQEKDAIESELHWLAALRRDTDIVAQEPRRNLEGEYVSLLGSADGGQPVPATLLGWLEGQDYRWDDADAEKRAHTLGVLNSRMHAHTRSWHVPDGFRRLHYDRGVLERALSELERGVQHGLIAQADYASVVTACEHILPLFDTVKRTPETWGLIHADLPWNLILRGDELIPIDFSLSGFGFYALDVVICATNLKKHLRQPYFDGLGVTLTDDYHWFVEASTIMIIMVSAARQITNPDWASWFQRRFPLIAGEYCSRLVRHETFIFDI